MSVIAFVFLFVYMFSYVECSRVEAGSESERTSVSDSLLPSYLLTGEYFTTGSSDYKCFLFVFFRSRLYWFLLL